MAPNKLTRRNGYVYGPKTEAGFLRMQRLGIPRPNFAVQNRIARRLKKLFKAQATKMLWDFKEQVAASGLLFQNKELVTDGNLEDLMAFFDEMGRQEKTAEGAAKVAGPAHNHQVNMAELRSVTENLRQRWAEEDALNNDYEDSPLDYDGLTTELDAQLKKNQKDFLNKMAKDASRKMSQIYENFSLDKKKLFEKNMEELRRLYINNSLERIAGEQDSLKRDFLSKLTDYVEGRTDTLNIRTLINAAVAYGDRMALMFARDQMARFNKAMTLATYHNAGVKTVRWITSHDQRVRQTHKDLDGQVFNIYNLPPEVDDYNCRCGLIPVDYEDDKKDKTTIEAGTRTNDNRNSNRLNWRNSYRSVAAGSFNR